MDVRIDFGKENPAGTLESINRLLPKMQHSTSIVPRRILGSMALSQGDIQLSREIYLSVEPRWLEPDQWPALMGDFLMETGCIVAWLFMNTGDQELGTALLEQTTAYIEDTLPLVTEHPDQRFPETCYLTAGNIEKALLSIETQLAHNHLADWYYVHQMPMYDQIRHVPRYQAVLAERERRIAVQREAIDLEREAGE